MKPLSIIIPTLNEAAYLPRLLRSIVDQKYDASIEVIVVDGDSSDDTLLVARKFASSLPGLKVYSSKRGISKQRNYGAAKAKHEALVFIDADMELTKSSLAEISKLIANDKNYIAMPLIYPYDGKPIDFILGSIAYGYFMFMQRSSPIISGMCIITTKKVHESIGGFDENITHAEDIDYGLRAVKSGATHRIFMKVRVRASARRLDTNGRVATGFAWLRWHRNAKKDRNLLYSPEKEYRFGEFK